MSETPLSPTKFESQFLTLMQPTPIIVPTTSAEHRQLRQLTLEQLRNLPQEEKVFVRLVVENATTILWEVYDFDTLLIERRARKRKGPLLLSIRPASFPYAIDFREKYTVRASVVISSTEEGTFYADCGALWILQAFAEAGQGRTLKKVEEAHVREFRRQQRTRR